LEREMGGTTEFKNREEKGGSHEKKRSQKTLEKYLSGNSDPLE
jgi:hypothetical protein